MRYQMREKMFSIGDDYWIENAEGQRVYKVDGKRMRVRKTFHLENASGQELLKIQEKKLSIRDAMRIERDGDTIATVRKAMISPLRDRYVISMDEGEDMKAKGSITDHNYKIERDGDRVAEVSKKWFRMRDTYGVEIEEGQNAPLILAITVCIEELGRGVVDWRGRCLCRGGCFFLPGGPPAFFGIRRRRPGSPTSRSRTAWVAALPWK